MESRPVHKFYVDSLEEILGYVNKIGKMCQDGGVMKPLWFRGQEYSHFNLSPNIFRGAKYHYNDKKTYSNNHLREDYRYQHFMSRNFDKTDYREPRSVFEWQEIMQHFFSKTRLMDWSESLFVALEFALEGFMIPYKNLEISEKRHKMQPTLWILQPNKLNCQVYESLLENSFSVLEQVLQDMKSEEKERICEELEKNRDIYFSLEDEGEQNFGNIVSLTALRDLKRSYAGWDKSALLSMELNPYFYLLLRIYADGVPVKSRTMPPLAVIHPYHSHRIRVQKGVFTVFPYYIPGDREAMIDSAGIKMNPMSMEYMAKCQDALYEIYLTNPEKIAAQMRQMGCKSSDLYPDTQRVAQDMESMDFTV